MLKVKKYTKLTPAELKRFWSTLESESERDTSPAMVNMYSSSWRLEQNTLRYILEIGNKFNPGEYFVVFDGRQPVASGGIHFSEWTDDIAMAGIRTWAHTEHRNKLLIAEYILPACKKWAVKNKCSAITLTFNEYNKNLIKVFSRIRIGEKADRITGRGPEKLFYNGVKVIDYPLEINYTKQWLIYESLSEIFDFNWQELRWKDKIKIVKRKLG